MKLNKLTKGLFAATAMMAAGVANADVLSEVSIDVQNLQLSVFADAAGTTQLFPGDGSYTLSGVGIDFNGTSVSTTLNGNGDTEGYAAATQDPFVPVIFDLNSNQSSSLASVDSNASITGNIFLPGGADGITSSSTDVGGYNFGETNSQISNSLQAAFNFTAQQDAFVQVSFDWLFDVLVDVTWSGGSGNADWAFEVTLGEKCSGIPCNAPAPIYSFDLNDDVLGASATGQVNQVGNPFAGNVNGSQDSGLLELMGGKQYELIIVQNANTSAASVSEPMSLAMFGLGLLGLAGAARRKAK